MDSGVKCVEEIDNADKQLVESVKSLLREVRGPFPESSLRRISYTVYLTDPNEELDITQYAIRGGSLVKVGETNQEKLERERIRREHGEQCRRRLRSMKDEYLIAMIARDEEEQRNLEREFDKMKAYL